MGAREFEIDQGAVLKFEAEVGDRLHVRFGDVWVTQPGDSNDYVLKTGESLTLSSKGATLAMAYKPTSLGWYHEARRARAREMWALLRRIFS